MQKTAITAAEIAPVLANRWSPRAYDVNHTASEHELLSILEAGRWAPSANNAQPWRFSIAARGTELFDQIVSAFTGFNQAWAPDASALIAVSVLKKTADGKDLPKAMYDAGLAASMMLVQAQELGLYTHHLAGIVREEIQQILNLDENLDLLVLIAVGKIAPAEQLEGPAYEREVAPRVRLDLDEIMIYGKP